MHFEVEKKFLVEVQKWNQVLKPEARLIRQGYLLAEDGRSVRIRTAGIEAFITIKAGNQGLKRLEFEYPIPLTDANELLKLCGNLVSKLRYRIFHHGRLWEVDEFLDENQGLVLAEIELKTEDEDFEMPPWVGKEVTGDERYYNAYLSQNSFGKQ